MLKNGKEQFDIDDFMLTAQQAYNIQQKINTAPEVNSTDKSDAIISNGAIESSETNNVNTSNQNFTLGMFETIGGTAAKRNVRTREQYYETYIKMGTLGLVNRALDIISDEASQADDSNNVLSINSNNEKIYDCLKTFFFDKLSINTELWSIFKETVKMGDNFFEVTLDVNDGMAEGIRRIKYLDPSKVEVHEKDGRVDYYVYKVQNSRSKSVVLEQRLFPWQVAHFKIEDKETKPYGKSLLFSGIRSFERLTATEDIFLTYVISRTPSRRVFKIDVGGLPQLEAQRAIREMRDSYRSQQVIDSEGNLNQISSILSITSDIFIPVREGQGGTSIETLQGDGMNMNQNMTFLDNFKNDLIASFNIPAEYIGMDGKVSADRSTTLSQKDIKFGRFIERIQQQIVKTLYKLATLELFFNGFKGEELKDFTIELTPPSTTKEISETGLLETKINLMQTMQGLGVFPTNWLLKRVLRLSDKEIAEIQFMKMIEDKATQQQQMMGAPGMGGGAGVPSFGGGAGAGMPTDFGGATEIGAGETPDLGEPPEGGEVPEVPAEPENLETQEVSYLNVDGQKFLIENKDDFVTLMKYIKFQNKNKKTGASEFMEEVNSFGEKKKSNHKSSNPYYYLNENNEFGGLATKSAKIYEGHRVAELPVLLG
jgi:hypothetical protein